MQNVRCATELLHVLRTGLVGRHTVVEKLCNLILSLSWKSTAVRQTTPSSSATCFPPSSLQKFRFFCTLMKCNTALDHITFYKYFCKETLFFFWINPFSSSAFGRGWLVLLSTEDFSMWIVPSNIQCASPLLSCITAGFRITIRGQ